MSRVTLRPRLLRALKMGALALLVFTLVRALRHVAWNSPLYSDEAIIDGLIGCALAFWFTWDSASGDEGKAQKK